MSSSMLASSSFLHLRTSNAAFNSPALPLLRSHNFTSFRTLKVASNQSSNDTRKRPNPILQNLKTLTKSAILIGVAASMVGRFSFLPARAEPPPTLTEQNPNREEEERAQSQTDDHESTPLSKFLESNVESLKSLLQEKLENGEDEEALKILKSLVAGQPSVTEWKFLMARLLNEMDQTENARNMFEEILRDNPLSFEALFENALLMDRCGEGEAVIKRLEEALEIAEEEKKVKEARDVRLIMAQIQFLQKNVEEALKSYQELSKEEPRDFRPYFCRGMIYSLLDRNEEAKEQFAKYRELSPKKFEVEGYLRTPLSRMKIFGSNEQN